VFGGGEKGLSCPKPGLRVAGGMAPDPNGYQTIVGP